MSGATKVLAGDLDITYEAVDANVKAGQLVVPSTTATSDPSLQGATPAGANATNVLGVASKDAVTMANRAALESSTGPAPLSAFVTDASVPDATFVAYNNTVTWVNYLAGTAVPYGAPLKAAAGGAVTLFVIGTDDPARKVGWCAQKGGVGTGGGTAKARINV